MSKEPDDFEDVSTGKLHKRRGSRVSPGEKQRRRSVLAKRRIVHDKLRRQRQERPPWKKQP